MKQRQRTDKRCEHCGEYPHREADMRLLLWSSGVPAGDGDLETRRYVLYLTRNDENIQTMRYRSSIDRRRIAEGDDARDTSRAEKLNKTGLLVLFPRYVDVESEAIIWVRQTNGQSVSWAEAKYAFPEFPEFESWKWISRTDFLKNIK